LDKISDLQGVLKDFAIISNPSQHPFWLTQSNAFDSSNQNAFLLFNATFSRTKKSVGWMGFIISALYIKILVFGLSWHWFLSVEKVFTNMKSHQRKWKIKKIKANLDQKFNDSKIFEDSLEVYMFRFERWLQIFNLIFCFHQ
jgi:hypothetical protein